MKQLSIYNLYASVEGKQILKGVSITVKPGQVHAVMGPNGSGKSTLAYALMGHPNCKVKSKITIGRKNIINLQPQERAKAGLFLAFQAPIAIPGVSVSNLLRTAYQELHGNEKNTQSAPVQNPLLARRWKGNGVSLVQFSQTLKSHAKTLRIDESFLGRGIHDGFSGGEKKKIEMLSALALSPAYAVFDEIDTGLDVDALKLVARGIELLVKQGAGVLIITHYQRILRYVRPDVVHILVDGKIVKTGSAVLAKEIEDGGYQRYATSH